MDRILSLLTAAAVLLPTASDAGVYRIQSRADWETWAYPVGAVELGEDGSLGLRYYRRNINAVANAADFEHESKDTGGMVSGGVRNAGSGAATAARVLDGDATTWWQPSMADDVDDWWIEIDLGRAVLANRLRLVFPDTVGAVPLRRFSVYTTEGSRTSLRADVYGYTREFVTITPNEERVVDIDLTTVDVGVATGVNLVTSDTLDWAAVQFVRIIAETKQEGAALADIEVWTPGDNIALGTVARGGMVNAGTNAENTAKLIDGSMSSWWTVTGERTQAGDWEMLGGWYEWTLGATFWIDRLVNVEYPEFWGTSGMSDSHQYGCYFGTSDGTELTGLAGERTEGTRDYELITEIENVTAPRNMKFDLQFPLRKVNSVFWHFIPHIGSNGVPLGLFMKLYEHMLFGEGYPAAVELTSDYIDLRGAKSMTTVTWEAATPPATRVELNSRTGDSFEVEVYYYTKSGKEISEAMWNKLPKSQKLDPVEIQRPAADWSDWSRSYVESGEAFLSPSPRRYVQLRLTLLSDDPQQAASFRSIALHYDEPLLRQGATGRIAPAEAGLDSLQLFTYTIVPVSGRNTDAGYDEVLIRVPAGVELEGVRIGAEDVTAEASEMLQDSLRVELPELVRRDSVQVRFWGRLQQTTTVFDAWLRNSRTGVRQGIKPAASNTTTVYVPAVAAGGLVRNLSVTPAIVTPNGDGVGDELQVRFTTVKVSGQPEVTIYSLQGVTVRQLAPEGEGFRWNGRDEAGEPVPPGVYICRVRVPADAGDETVYRVINLAY